MANAVPEVVLQALEKAIQQEGECRLVAQGKKYPGLFPGGPPNKAKSEAIKHCLDENLDLFKVRTERQGSQTAHFVTVTSRGVETLFQEKPQGDHGRLLAIVAGPYKEAAIKVGRKLAEQSMTTLGIERQHLAAREKELFEFLYQTTRDRLNAMEAERKRLDEAIRNLADLQAQLGQPQAGPIAETKKAGDRIGQQEAKTEAELDFQRDLCEELVYAWQDAANDETRDALERVMQNAGLEPVGEPGQAVPFDGRQHVTQDQLRAGDGAVVQMPGWRLVNARGSYLIARARVQQQSAEQEVAHHVHDDQH